MLLETESIEFFAHKFVQDILGVYMPLQTCLDLSDSRNNINGLKTWADYLFPNLDGSPEEISFVFVDEEV